MKRVCIISLGCPKNTVDSEKIIGILGSSGYMVSGIPEESDFVIVNTCAFIKPAVEESKQIILNLKKKKKKYGFRLVITGCLPVREKSFLFNDSDIDGVIGPYHIEKLPGFILDIETGKRVQDVSFSTIKHYCKIPRIISTLPYAYLKIAEGCNNHCSYCTIPSIRGPLFSYPEKEILKEAEHLLISGVKELIIVAHDITSYGRNRYDFCRLLKKIISLGFPWIRLMYLHPSGITPNLLETMNKNSSVCKYLDIPLQHVNPLILKRMNRPVMDYKKMIEEIRKAVPQITLRTTFIVGFPGETEDIFNELIEFVRELRFERMGAFIYWPERNTRAYFLKGQVPFETKKKRFLKLMDIQKNISKEIADSFVGKVLDVLIEKEMNGYLSGRTQMDAPEIDWTVKVYGKARPGDIVKVKITKNSEYSLSGKICFTD